MHVKKGDQVLVIAGNDKGKRAVIKEAYPREQRVLVEGINMRWRHRKPTQQNPKGERVQVEASIHVSNVALDAKTPQKKAKKPAAAKAKAKAKPAKKAE
jgi:large subunit ribosomal protein L24